MSPGASGVKCGSVRTVIEVRDCLQDVAIGVESFWPTDSTGDVSVRVQDDLGIDKVTGGDPVVQSLAKRNGGHVCRLSETDPFRCLSYLYYQRPQKRAMTGRLQEVLGPRRRRDHHLHSVWTTSSGLDL